MRVKSLNNYFIKDKKDNLFGSLKKERKKILMKNKIYFMTLLSYADAFPSVPLEVKGMKMKWLTALQLFRWRTSAILT